MCSNACETFRVVMPANRLRVNQLRHFTKTVFFTLAFFLMCFNRPDTGCGPGAANFPLVTRFNKGRWKCLKLSFELNVGKNGRCNSMAGVECYKTSEFKLCKSYCRFSTNGHKYANTMSDSMAWKSVGILTTIKNNKIITLE